MKFEEPRMPRGRITFRKPLPFPHTFEEASETSKIDVEEFKNFDVVFHRNSADYFGFIIWRASRNWHPEQLRTGMPEEIWASGISHSDREKYRNIAIEMWKGASQHGIEIVRNVK